MKDDASESVFGLVCDSFSVEIPTPCYRLHMAWLFNRWYHAINPNYLQNPFLQPIQLNTWFRPGRKRAIDYWGVKIENWLLFPSTALKFQILKTFKWHWLCLIRWGPHNTPHPPHATALYVPFCGTWKSNLSLQLKIPNTECGKH